MIQLIREKLTHRHDDPCYIIDDKKIFSKFYAMLTAQNKCTTNDPNELWQYIKFQNYINHTGTEPHIDIRDLYKKRAVQIREHNEYVRIWASGGTDSTNVIHAFHNAGVQPDEIATYLQYPGAIHASQNAEVDFSLRPFIKEIKQWWPNVKIKFYDVLPEHYHWYSKNAIEHWMAYTQLHPPAFSWNIAYEVYPDLQEHSAKYQTANVYSGVDCNIGVDKNGWYYRFVDQSYNDALNAPYQIFFYATPEAKDLWLKVVHCAKKHLLKTAQDTSIPFEDQILGEWSIKTGRLAEMQFWLPESIEFGRNLNKANYSGILNWGPKGSLRFHNMISSVTGQTTLLNFLHYHKEVNNKYPHWFTNHNIMEDWIGIRTKKIYFGK